MNINKEISKIALSVDDIHYLALEIANMYPSVNTDTGLRDCMKEMRKKATKIAENTRVK